MQRYFERLQPKAGEGVFSAGLVWVDGNGIAQASAVPGTAAGHPDLSGRSYVWTVMATGKPFVSEGTTAWPGGAHVIVTAVPTRDARGRLTGVLAAAVLPGPLAITRGSLDLGDSGVSILDRAGRSVLPGFPRPTNLALLRSLGGTGMRADTRGLDGSRDHAIAYTTSTIPGWTIMIDRPRSVLFADARRGLFLELALVAAAAAIVLFLIALVLLHGRREAERERKRSHQRHELTRILGSASLGSDVSDGLVAGLADAFPGALCIVALEAPDGPGLALSGSADGAFPTTEATRDIVVAQAATLAYESGSAIVIGKEPELRSALPGVHNALRGAAHSFYATPLVAPGGSRLGALCLLFAHAHPLDESEQAQVAWYAEQAAQALDRTSAFEREHEVAVRLQRSLLSQRLPEVEGVEFDRPLQRGRRRTRGRRRLVRRGAQGPTAWCVPVGDVAGPASRRQCSWGNCATPSARTPTSTPRPRSCCGGCFATSTRTRWRPHSGSRSIRTRRSSPTRLRAILPRCSSTANWQKSVRVSGTRSHARSAMCRPRRSARQRSSCPRAPTGGVHRRPRRAPRLEHRQGHRSPGVGARILLVARRRLRWLTGSSRRSRRASARATTSRS